MSTPLRKGLLILVLLAGALSAGATHLLGGEISYRYLNAGGPAATPFRYQVTVLIYVNKEPGSNLPNGNPTITLLIEDRRNNAGIQEIIIPQTSLVEVTAPNGNCTGLATRPPRVALAKYTVTVSLPPSTDGYRAVVAERARNVGVTNLLNSGSTSMVLSTDMAPPFIPNSSPVFSDTAVAIICQGDTTLLLNNAYDADGDRLSYAFGTPSATYAPGYSQAQPFGSGGFAALNANTGLSQYASPRLGKFAVAVDVSEYRTINGTEVLLGSTRRDIQLVVRTCPPNAPPAFSAPTLAVKDFFITEGDALAFNLVAADPDGQRLTMRVASALLDGAGPIDATFNNNPGVLVANNPIGSASTTGMGTVSGTFRLNSRCGAARTLTHDVVVTVTDDACAGQTVAEVFRITVSRAAAPSRILGDSLVCAQNPGIYTAVGATASSYRWTVQGGQVQGSATGRSVQVLWGTGPTGIVTVRPVAACLADSVARTIAIVPSNFVTLGPNPPICPGATAELTASGAQTYTWTGGGITRNGPRVVVAPLQTTTYVLYAVNGNCTTSRYVTVTVNPLVITGPRRFCPEARTNLTYATTSVPGVQYQWSITGGTITAGQGSATVQLSLPAGASAATLQVANSLGCNASLTLLPDNAHLSLDAASVVADGQDRSIELALQVPEATATTGSLQAWRRPADSPGPFLLVGTAPPAATSFTDTGVDADAYAYDYRLELTNGCGTVLASQEHTTVLARATALQPPEGRAPGRARVEWSAYRGFPVLGYRLLRQVDGKPAETVATLPATARSFELPTGGLGFTQCFRVQALSTDASARTASSNETCLLVENKLAFYNIITPNGDGKNDALVIDNVGLYPGNSLTVYSRWGREVYHARDYDNTYDGAGTSPGLYYYLFRLPDGTAHKGWLEIVR
jgi:gliding motility-associated-like protein